MAEVNPDGTIVAEMDKAFKQKVEELSSGKIKIDLHLGGALGDEENIMPIIRGENSSIHLMRISAFSLAARGCTKTSLLANHFHEVAPNMILDGHTLGVTEVIINSNVWDSLSNSQQHILQVAGSYAGEVCRKFSQEAEDKAKAQLIAEGAVFTEVNDLTPWKQACEKIISESSKADSDLYQKILDMAK
ncbi:hypothetical protein [Treponema sp. UBA3813]|uniref:hypothetical protein n=1 Tax=Treponema sp. UBA3813 TaxID=1947715 RepID=UPI0025F9B428|nr:hypothetical protein [Treponema sp. UBA3813]